MFRLEEKSTGFTIDVLFEADGMEYRKAFARADKIYFGNYPLYIASLKDILDSKLASNRPKDTAVIPLLEMTLHEKENFESN